MHANITWIFCKFRGNGYSCLSDSTCLIFILINLTDGMLYFTGSLNIGPKQDILEYCKAEWRGQTKRASIMQKVKHHRALDLFHLSLLTNICFHGNTHTHTHERMHTCTCTHTHTEMHVYSRIFFLNRIFKILNIDLKLWSLEHKHFC